MVQECHVHIGDDLSMIADDQAMITCECADDAGFDLLDGADIQQRLKVCMWNGQHHTFLRFREPDFPGG